LQAIEHDGLVSRAGDRSCAMAATGRTIDRRAMCRNVVAAWTHRLIEHGPKVLILKDFAPRRDTELSWRSDQASLIRLRAGWFERLAGGCGDLSIIWMMIHTPMIPCGPAWWRGIELAPLAYQLKQEMGDPVS